VDDFFIFLPVIQWRKNYGVNPIVRTDGFQFHYREDNMKHDNKLRHLRCMSAALLACGLATSVWADDSAPASSHTVTANVGLFSNYIYRGLGQTWDRPALQGGVDYAHADGWYAGLWGANVSDKQYAGGGLEVDYYFGYNGKINDDLGWTAGFFGWYYPGANYNKVNPLVSVNGDQDYDNQELNAGVSYKWLSAKINYALSDYFGANKQTGYTDNTRGTTYLELNANVPLPENLFSKDVVLGLHYGHTHYTANLEAATTGGAAGGRTPGQDE